MKTCTFKDCVNAFGQSVRFRFSNDDNGYCSFVLCSDVQSFESLNCFM